MQLHLPLPVRLGVGHGSGEDLQALLVLVARRRLAAGHTLTVQSHIRIGNGLIASTWARVRTTSTASTSLGPYGPVTSPISGRSRPVRCRKCRPTRLV